MVDLPKPRRSAEGCEEATDTATPCWVTRCGLGLVEGFGSGWGMTLSNTLRPALGKGWNQTPMLKMCKKQHKYYVHIFCINTLFSNRIYTGCFVMHLQYSSSLPIWFSLSEQEKNLISGYVSRNVLFPPYHFICFTKPLSSWELFDVLNWTFAWRFIIPRGNSKQITHFIPMAIFIKLYFKSIFLKFSEQC